MSPIYWVLFASLLVWGGLFLYLWSTDRRLRALERRLDAEERR